MRKEVKSRKSYRRAYKRRISAVKNTLILGAVLCMMLAAAKLIGSRMPMVEMLIKNPSLMLQEEEYPQELLDMLSRNPEMREFVMEYPKKKGNVYADTVGEVTKGEFPLLIQWDEKWGYSNYGDSSIAVSGCGPTALSSVIAGLTGSNQVTPYTVAKYAEENGYYVEGTGTSWELFTRGGENFGVKGEEISLTKTAVFQALENGKPIICSMRSGDFTTAGHFIVLIGIEDGKIKVNDSNSKQNSEKLWEYEVLEPQIKNLWAFQRS